MGNSAADIERLFKILERRLLYGNFLVTFFQKRGLSFAHSNITPSESVLGERGSKPYQHEHFGRL